MLSDVLVLIPGNEVLNMIATTLVFILVAHEVNQITNDLIPILVPEKTELLLRNMAYLFVIVFVIISSENLKDLNF
jgi:hypothetical protein